jgi:hypothetical protein
MANILATQSAEMQAKGEAPIQQADKLPCESWNERMWSNGEPIDPSPTIDQAVHGGFPWLEIQCTRCTTPNDADQARWKHPPTTLVRDLAIRLRRRKRARRPDVPRRPSSIATVRTLKHSKPIQIDCRYPSTNKLACRLANASSCGV